MNIVNSSNELYVTPENRLRRAFCGLSMIVVLVVGLMAVIGQAQASDVDVYTSQPNLAEERVMIIALDLNYTPDDVVCQDVALGGTPTAGVCELLNDTLQPILEAIQLENGILGLFDDVIASILAVLPSPIDFLQSTAAMTEADVARIVLYDTLIDLLGTKVAIMINHQDTCDAADYAAATDLNSDGNIDRASVSGCSNGAFFALGLTSIDSGNVISVIDSVVGILDSTNVGIALAGSAGFDSNGDYQASLTSDTPQPTLRLFQGKELYYEIYRYLTGGEIYNAPLGADDLPPLGRDTSLENAGVVPTYISPVQVASCQDVYVLNILFSDPAGQDDSDADLAADLPGIDLDNDGNITFAETVEYFEDTGFRVPTSSGLAREIRVYSRFLVNAASVTDNELADLIEADLGSPTTINPIPFQDVSTDAFDSIKFDEDGTTSFNVVAPSVAFSVRNNTELVSEILIPRFAPALNNHPEWNGNLKKLALDTNADGDLVIVDKNTVEAVDSVGNIKDTATTFWTVGSPDGGYAHLGGAKSRINAPGFSNATTGVRQLFYDLNATGPLEPLDANDANQLELADDLGVPVDTAETCRTYVTQLIPPKTKKVCVQEERDDVERDLLIKHARGVETEEDELDADVFEAIVGTAEDTINAARETILGTLNDTHHMLLCDEGLVTLTLRITISLLGSITLDCSDPPDLPDPNSPPVNQTIMGDVIHSRPLAIDYGQTVSGQRESDFKVFVGTNFGYLHQFDNSNGSEDWAFMPRKVMKNLKTFREGTNITSDTKPYGVDGASVVYYNDADNDGLITAGTTVDRNNDGDTSDLGETEAVYLYFGLRRGGKALYAMDITNKNAATPTLLWRKEVGDLGYEELGMTFSTPRLTSMQIDLDDDGTVDDDEIRQVLVMGAGYNGGPSTGKDNRVDVETNSLGTDDIAAGQGNAILIIDAFTGEVLWKTTRHDTVTSTTGWSAADEAFYHPQMQDSVASAVTSLDLDGDGRMEKLYVGDTGGRVWRADFPSADRSTWQAVPVMNVGRHDVSAEEHDRRFFHRPDFVQVDINSTVYNAVIIGSGNRANPLSTNTRDFMYMYKDAAAVPDLATWSPVAHDDFTELSTDCSTVDGCVTNPVGPAGWKLQLLFDGGVNNGLGGEKSLGTPITVGGIVQFTTFMPPQSTPTQCIAQDAGGRIYALNLLDGDAVVRKYESGKDGDGDARSTALYQSGLVGDVAYVGPGQFLRSDLLIENDSDLSHQTGWKTYWRERLSDD